MARGTDRLDERVAEVAAEVLGEPPGEDGELALDSLEQAELALALEDAFEVRLPDDVRFRTLADAAREVRARRTDGSAPLPPRFGRMYPAAERLLAPVLGSYYRLEVTGAEHVPLSGPAVVAANHDSLLDIPLLSLASPRPIWFMAKQELFRGPVVSWLFHALGGFPVRREGFDLRAIRAALAVVRSGRLLGMYPEGTRGPHLLPFRPGAAWVALAVGVPVVPVGISGTGEAMPRGSKVPRRADVRIAFGEAMELGQERDPRARLERARKRSQELRSEVERLIAR